MQVQIDESVEIVDHAIKWSSPYDHYLPDLSERPSLSSFTLCAMVSARMWTFSDNT